LYFASNAAPVRAAFPAILGEMTIGSRIGKPLDRNRQLAGDLWFYYGGRYGEYLGTMKQAGVEDYLPAMVEATSAWRGVHDVGANFWSEHQVGHRICEWFEKTLADDADAPAALASIRDDLGKCLDVLVRSGIASARTLEARLADDRSFRKSA